MNRQKTWKLFILVVLSMSLLVASWQHADLAPVLSASVAEDPNSPEQAIIAEAVIEPARWSKVRFTMPGEVTEVYVSVGDQVAAGDLLAVLDDTAATLAVREAEAALVTARAHLAQVKATPRAASSSTFEAQLAVEEKNLARAKAARAELLAGGRAAEIAAAQASLEAAQALQHQAQASLQWAEDDGDATREVQAHADLHAANLKITATEAQLAAWPRISAAEVQVAEARVRMAEAQCAVVQARLDLLRASPLAEEIRVAEISVRQAELALAFTETTLRRTRLYAPFDGTVTQPPVEVGSKVTPAQTVLTLATLDDLHVRTTDLLELDIPDVMVGHSVSVHLDALPGVTLPGHVTQIGWQGIVERGDVTYPVWIALDSDTPDAMLWGMTAMVNIPIDKQPPSGN